MQGYRKTRDWTARVRACGVQSFIYPESRVEYERSLPHFCFLFWKVQPHAVLRLEEWAICWARGATLCWWSCWPNNRTDIIVSPSESSLLFPLAVLSPILFRHVSQWTFSFCPSSHPSLHLSLCLFLSLSPSPVITLFLFLWACPGSCLSIILPYRPCLWPSQPSNNRCQTCF